MAPYQPPTVEEIEDEFDKNMMKQNQIQVQVTGLGAPTAATSEAKRPRKRKSPWEYAQRLSKVTYESASCR